MPIQFPRQSPPFKEEIPNDRSRIAYTASALRAYAASDDLIKNPSQVGCTFKWIVKNIHHASPKIWIPVYRYRIIVRLAVTHIFGSFFSHKFVFSMQSMHILCSLHHQIYILSPVFELKEYILKTTIVSMFLNQYLYKSEHFYIFTLKGQIYEWSYFWDI